MSKVYPFTAYDKHMSLKLDSNMWLIIVYFLRPFIMKISTIQMGRGAKSDSASGLKDLVYPNDFGFFLAFIATIPVLILIFAYAKRKPEAADYVKSIWQNGRKLLVAAAVLNIIIIFVPFLIHITHTINVYGWGQLAVAIGIIVYLYQSKRVTDTFGDFPKETEVDEARR